MNVNIRRSFLLIASILASSTTITVALVPLANAAVEYTVEDASTCLALSPALSSGSVTWDAPTSTCTMAGTLILNDGDSLVISNALTFAVNGYIINYGSITITSNADLTLENGGIDNRYILATNGGGVVTNNAGSNILVKDTGLIDNYHDVNNYGTIENNGSIVTYNVQGTFNNHGEIINNNFLSNSGLFNNYLSIANFGFGGNDFLGTFNNAGTIVNDCDAQFGTGGTYTGALPTKASHCDSAAPAISDISDSPDPFTPNESRTNTATITFTSDEAGSYQIDIKDSSGNIGAQMWGTLVQGTNAAQWDGYFYYGLAPAGEYYYFINTLDSSNNQRIPITPDGQITVNPTSPPPIWTINGFYQPVDMNGVTNVVRGGQTVPLRFEVFDEYGVERTSVSDISSFTQTRINCGELSGDPQDQIEETNSLLTNLQYNGQTGYYQANWKTPKQPNTCWEAKVTTADGSSLAAFFKLK